MAGAFDVRLDCDLIDFVVRRTGSAIHQSEECICLDFLGQRWPDLLEVLFVSHKALVKDN